MFKLLIQLTILFTVLASAKLKVAFAGELLSEDLADQQSILRKAGDFGKMIDDLYQVDLKIKKPIYSWRADDVSDAVFNSEWANKNNINYLDEILSIQTYMKNQLKDYSIMYIRHDDEKVIKTGNTKMLNGFGDAHQQDCYLITFLHPLYFLKYHSPQESKVVVDIGSGWGTCAKLMAHLGYKVYSVDLDEKHLEYQRDHFCDIPDKDSFLSIFWKRNNPELLKADNFLRHCRTAQNNITYIQGDFADASTVSKLKDQKWDIVIATYSTHFMNDKQRNNVWGSIKNHLKPRGSFVLTMTHTGKICSKQASVFSPVVCDFSLEEVYEQYFDRYKILTLWLDDQQRLSGYTLVKP